MKKEKPKFHPKAPRRLRQLWKTYPAHYRIAQYLNVNVGYVWKALMKGKEPVNESVRVKFGLPRKPRKPRTPKTPASPIPAYAKWWNRLDPQIREQYKKETFEKWTNNNQSI